MIKNRIDSFDVLKITVGDECRYNFGDHHKSNNTSDLHRRKIFTCTKYKQY